MIRIAVVEDEAVFAEQLTQFLNTYQNETQEPLSVTLFSDGDEILQNYHSQFDLIFLDIQMKFVNGMTTAEEIRKMDSEVAILFITSLPQYAIRGYEVGALDYILKPLSYFSFSKKLKRAIDKLRRKADHYVTLTLKGGGVLRVNVSHILYIESEGHNLIYHMHTEENLIVPGTMRQAEDTFRSMNFSRGNKGYLINLQHVEGIRDKCALVHGELLLLSRNRYDAFLKDLTIYWSEIK